MAGSLAELAQTRWMLGARHEATKSGCVKPVDGEEASHACKLLIFKGSQYEARNYRVWRYVSGPQTLPSSTTLLRSILFY